MELAEIKCVSALNILERRAGFRLYLGPLCGCDHHLRGPQGLRVSFFERQLSRW